MQCPLWEVTMVGLAGGQEGPSHWGEPSFSPACCATGVLGREKPPSTCTLWAHSLLTAAGRARRSSRHEAQPEVGSRASQVPAVPAGLCRGEEAPGGCWGQHSWLPAQIPPVPSTHPVIRKLLRNGEVFLGVFLCGLLFFFGINLLFQLLKLTVSRAHTFRVNVI